ncbi:hypothetical protein M9H77_10478 [Catharanthus roseus]|uniref:Uncharacterized protein n=1 Tax=Catharanthus roseus TaxID=4058 RepID=A0ACC0BBT6_CATRO|nr:hypothetical protein M9H77_10478 [Catharanthus roseus]
MLSLSTFLSSSNLILQAILCLSLTVFLSFLNIPALFLYGLHTYVHPDDVTPNNSSRGGVKAAIRRPGTVESELKPRKKSKEKFEFDESKAQIFRLKLNDGHLQTRIYFKQFSGAFNSTIVAISCLLLQKFLRVSKESGILKNGSVIPISLGFAGICRVFVLIVKISFERSASKSSEKLLSILLGVIGFFWGLAIVCEMVPQWVIDIDFKSLDGLVKLFIAIFMGCIVGFFYTPAMKNARAFWLGTDQIRCNLSIISCGWFARMLLYANYFLVVFTSTLWFSPFTEILLNKKTDGTKGLHFIVRNKNPGELAGSLGMTQSDFHKFRVWCLLGSGLLQFLSLRPNVQMFLNEAVLCWYQRLHSSKVPDLAYSRAKVFLHNHYICLVALQFFAPAAMILLFLGLSQIDDYVDFERLSGLVPSSALVKEVALFLAWWAIFVWATFTSMALALYRRGVLYVS